MIAMLPLLFTPTVFAADPVDTLVKQEMEKRKIPGLSVAVVKDGKVIKSAGYGIANIETQTPATADTVYELASVTKQFTAAAVLLLVQDGKVQLDDTLSKFVPEVPEAWKPVTVRQLLNHTSGIFSLTSLPDYFNPATIRRDYPPKEIIKLVADKPLEFAPGTRWNYNNTGYTLLGMVIESASGKTYGDFLKERIFMPLKMTQTRVNDFRTIIPHRAMGYSFDGGTLTNCEYVSPTHPWAAGALVSTVQDLARWDTALNTETILTNASRKLMWTPTTLSDGKVQNYGFGWELENRKGHPIQQHGGGIPGFSTHILRLPVDKVSVVVLSNLDGTDTGAIGTKIAAIYVPDVAPEVAKPIPDPKPERTARLKALITRLTEKGEADESAFTPDFWQHIYPTRLKEAPGNFGTFGPLKEFLLTEQREENDVEQLAYRAIFGTTTFTIRFTLTKEGKIAGLGFRAE